MIQELSELEILRKRLEAMAKELEAVKKQAAAMRSALESLVNDRVQCCDGKPSTHAWLAPETREVINKALASQVGCDYVPRLELEAVKKQAAAMRDALNDTLGYFKAIREQLGNIGEWVTVNTKIERLEDAVSPSAGRDYISRESVKPLANGF